MSSSQFTSSILSRHQDHFDLHMLKISSNSIEFDIFKTLSYDQYCQESENLIQNNIIIDHKDKLDFQLEELREIYDTEIKNISCKLKDLLYLTIDKLLIRLKDQFLLLNNSVEKQMIEINSELYKTKQNVKEKNQILLQQELDFDIRDHEQKKIEFHSLSTQIYQDNIQIESLKEELNNLKSKHSKTVLQNDQLQKNIEKQSHKIVELHRQIRTQRQEIKQYEQRFLNKNNGLEFEVQEISPEKKNEEISNIVKSLIEAERLNQIIKEQGEKIQELQSKVQEQQVKEVSKRIFKSQKVGQGTLNDKILLVENEKKILKDSFQSTSRTKNACHHKYYDSLRMDKTYLKIKTVCYSEEKPQVNKSLQLKKQKIQNLIFS